jgi:hypothetical protein
MIELHADSGSGREARLILRPNRAMRASQHRAIFFALAAVATGTSLFSWTQGNAVAPLIALLRWASSRPAWFWPGGAVTAVR